MTISSLPPAHCRICGSMVRAVKFSTFSYWYCDRCKDEVEVWLKTVGSPKGEILYALIQDSDINIDKPGIYSIHYCDGTHEWYEHTAHKRPIRLSGALVSAASRTPDSDLPSRKRMQPEAKTSSGEADSGLRIRTVSDKADSSAGNKEDLPFIRWNDPWPQAGKFITFSPLGQYWLVDQDDHKDKELTEQEAEGLSSAVAAIRGSISGVSLSPGSIVPLQNLDPDDISIQHGSLPPDDTL